MACRRDDAFATVYAFALLAATGCATSGAPAAVGASGAAFAGIAATTAALYKAVDDATADAYVAQALLAGTKPAMSQSCFMPDHTVATRPSVLANPPYPAAAIAQRKLAVGALVAYADVLASVVDETKPLDAANAAANRAAAAHDAAARAAADFARAAAAFRAAANEHENGDLFIEDVAATLKSGAQHIAQRDLKSRKRTVVALAPVVEKLTGILRDDANRAKNEALAATALAERRWLAYANRGAPPSAAERQSLPSCFEPAVPSRNADASAPEPPSASPSAAIAARLADIRSRQAALRSMHLGDFFSAYIALDQAAVSALSGGDPTTFADALTRAETAAAHANLSR